MTLANIDRPPVAVVAATVLDALNEQLEELVLSPTARPTARELAGWAALLDGLDLLVRSTKARTKEAYGWQDLVLPGRRLEPDYLRAQHALKVLEAVHGERELIS